MYNHKHDISEARGHLNKVKSCLESATASTSLKKSQKKKLNNVLNRIEKADKKLR